MTKIIAKAFKILGLLLLTAFLALVLANGWVYQSTKGQLVEGIEDMPEAEVALVLGTSPKLMTGDPNPYFHERLQIAADLYSKGKVKHIIVSGDNQTRYYNEPARMLNGLVELGVPETGITRDSAGFRTLDSIVRCKKVFGQDNIIIITQPFHSHRALFISNFYEMNAHAPADSEIPAGFSYKVKVREYLARALAIWDLYIINKEPEFLGTEKELNI